jgi:fatty acid desaturase
MEKLPVWDPYKSWKPAKIQWVKVDISKEDLKRFNQRSDIKGLVQTLSFLLIIALTAFLSYYAFKAQYWLLMTVGLYLHGMIYGHFGDGIHELTHNTVFKSKALNKATVFLFGVLCWPYNPYFYRISHVHFHHQYTLHQNSDGEDVANYADLSAKAVLLLFFNVIHIKQLLMAFYRLFTLKPVSLIWRLRGFSLDQWEKFILERASEKERKAVYRFAAFSLAFHVLFSAACIITGNWFLIILITLAPFYGPGIHLFLCAIQQHACCNVNEPDFRKSCGDAILDPISSILYWHMEFHIEHHMFASIPCYNLKKFSRFAADQMPAKEYAIPRVFKLARRSKEMYGSWEQWREDYGRFKGL